MTSIANAESHLAAQAALLPRLFDYVDRYAAQKPKAPAIIANAGGKDGESTVISWKEFRTKSRAFSAKLLAMGLRRGDVLATTLSAIPEHLYLMYGAFRLGVIVAPLDLRLKADEVCRNFRKIKPKAYFFLGETPAMDFRPMVRQVMAQPSTCLHWIQFQKSEEGILDGAVSAAAFARDIPRQFLTRLVTGQLRRAEAKVQKRDPAVIIFTTGSTGEPKPAMLAHENILLQNAAVCVAFGAKSCDRMLVNLPMSHVGCLTEQLATIVYAGGVAVLIPVFKPDESLRAIERHRVTLLGQIPAVFNLEWQRPEYENYDLSSLRFAIYGGQGVSREFLEKLSTMASQFGSGLGLTETAGFCTYTPPDIDVERLSKTLGHASPLCPMTLRHPMNADGTAGPEVATGEIGEVCFSGPQIFLGYLDAPEATAKTISRDGWLYTGDLGKMTEDGLALSGRRKFVIKPKGYQVFPGDVENGIASRLEGRAGAVAVVGVEHRTFSEAIVAFVEKSSPDLTVEEVERAAKCLAAYARPSHVELLPPNSMPLNRVAKTDYTELQVRAKAVVADLRGNGRWDAGPNP